MKFFSLFVFLMLLFRLIVEGQQVDTISLPRDRPLMCGFIKKTIDTSFSTIIEPNDGVQIFTCSSKSDSVFSLSKGSVLAVRKIDDEFLCIIKFSNFVVTYSSLSSSPLKKGLIIRKGDYIGKLYSDDDSKFVRIVIRKNNRVLSYEKHLSCMINAKWY